MKLTIRICSALLVAAAFNPAAGTIGSAIAAKSAPDGYTLLIGYTSSIMISPTLLSSAGFNPVDDLAKARPGQINYASAGTGGGQHQARIERYFIGEKIDVPV